MITASWKTESTRRFPLLLLLFLLFGLCASASAAVVSGRASVWSYAREDTANHVVVVPQLSVTIHQLGRESLSFQTTLRGFYDFRDGESSDEQVRIQRAVFIYAPRKSRWEIRAGQQWLTEGVGRGTIAGLWARYKASPKLSLTAYGGPRLSRSISLVTGNEDNGIAAGVHARTKIGRHRLGLSYTYTGKEGDILYHGVGVDGVGRFHSKLNLRARLHMNLEQSTVETAQLVAAWKACEKVDVTAELRRQTPRIFEDSYFVRFLEHASTDFVRAAMRWTFYKTLYMKPGASALFAEDELFYKVRLAFGIPIVEFGFTHWLSISEGAMDGFYGQAQYRIGRFGQVFGGFDFSKGSNSDMREDVNSHVTYLGARYNITNAINVSGRVEHIEDFERSEDIRGLFSLSARFSTLHGSGR